MALPDAAAAGRGAVGLRGHGGLDPAHLARLHRRRGDLPAGGMADRASTCHRRRGRHSERSAHRLSPPRKHRATARRHRVRLLIREPQLNQLAGDLAIVGAGSWGTALAVVLATRFPRIRLWVYEKDLAERRRPTRINDVYLPGFSLPADVTVETDFAAALAGAAMVLSVMPSHLVRPIYGQMLPCLDPSMVFVSATKGLENGTLLRASQVIRDCVSGSFEPRVAVISGPTFAREVARGDPTALVVASTDQALAVSVQASFSGPTFRLYTSPEKLACTLT